MTPKQSNTAQSYNVRIAVINTLLAIQQGKSLNSLLDPLLNNLNSEDKGFAHALLLTTLRHWYATGRLLDSLADNPIDEISVRTTIQLGITQLLYLNVADHAAIHETVEAVKHIDFAHASGLVNAILRKVAKNPNKFRKRANKNHSLPNWLAQQLKADWREHYDVLTQSLRQSAPMFLRINSLQSDSDLYLKSLTDAKIEAKLVHLDTVINLDSLDNLNSLDRTHTAILKDSAIGNTVGKNTAVINKINQINQSAIELIDSVSVSQLPQFEKGIASVQDAHAQLAAPILHKLLTHKMGSNTDINKDDNSRDGKKNDSQIRLLDACAAPGGKLAHWLELLGSEETNNTGLFHVKQVESITDTNTASFDKIQIIAIDNEASRITRIFENLERLQLPAPIVNSKLHLDIECVDATTWQAKTFDKDSVANQSANDSESGFDAILLDAPCTATGVIRRHPDITLLRTEEDVPHTVQLQEQILDNLWPQLKAGGYLLYVTCSILKAENSEQMQAFLTRHKDAVAIEFNNKQTNWGVEQPIGRQCLPLDDATQAGGDGFYYAIMQKSFN